MWLKIKSLLMHFACIKKIIIKKEGGQQESITLRYKTKKCNRVDVDLYTYGSCFDLDFNMSGSVKIGRYCSFAKNVRFLGANHPMNYISTSPYFYNKSFGFDVTDVEHKCLTIENDVWVGHSVIITSGCERIGTGAVVAAGSVVTKDIPPYAVVAGVPARIIKYRFTKEEIDMLLRSSWWNHSPDEVMKYYGYIDNPTVFCELIQSEK